VFARAVETGLTDTILLAAERGGLRNVYYGTPAKIAREMARLALTGTGVNVPWLQSDTALLAARGFSGINRDPLRQEDERWEVFTSRCCSGLPTTDVDSAGNLQRWQVIICGNSRARLNSSSK